MYLQPIQQVAIVGKTTQQTHRHMRVTVDQTGQQNMLFLITKSVESI
jgi:hypothetical protein